MTSKNRKPKSRKIRNRKPKSLGALTIAKAKLDGFKAVKSSGYVDLQNLTLFIGRNGSGKSSFVEALQWLQDAFFDGLLEATESRFRSYLYLRNMRTTFTRLHLEFNSTEQEQLYYDLDVRKAAGRTTRPIVWHESMRYRRNRQVQIISTSKGSKGPVFRKIFGSSPERDADRLAIYSASVNAHAAIRSMSEFIRRMVVLRLSPTTMRWQSSLDQKRGPMLDEEGARLPALLASLDKGQREWVRQKVSSVIAGISDVKVITTEPSRGYIAVTERMKSKGGNAPHEIPAWMLSEGTRRMTALFALLAVRPQPSLLVVEEIENGLDPWTLEHIFSELREISTRGTQVIVTTHSPFLLDHVAPEEVIHVQRERGDSTYKPITKFSDVSKYKGVVAPGMMYISGYFGGDER